MSTLHDTINDWNNDQIKWLLDHGAYVNERDADGSTPLILAVSKHLYQQHVLVLIDRGADIRALDRTGRTPLMAALDNGFLDGVETLLAQYAIVGEIPEVDPNHEQGRLALLLAIYKNDAPRVESLLDAGADPNAKNQFGRTPLMLAVELGHAEIAAILLRRGADVNTREDEGNAWTALHLTAYNRQPDCARILLEHGAEVDAGDIGKRTALIMAASASSAAIVRLLLERGADIQAEDAEGGSALAEAGWMGDEDTIRTLLDWGAASNPKHLRDAFHAAFVDNNLDKSSLFIKAGVRIGLPEAVLLQDTGLVKSLLAVRLDQAEIDSALVTAAGHASPEIVRLLLDHGADPNARSGDQTALMQAYNNYASAFAIIEALLSFGADVNARDQRGNTPVTMRSGWQTDEDGRLRLLRMICKFGADVNALNIDGRSTLMDAAWAGQTSVAQFLLENGAQVNVRDKDGHTALMMAATEGHTETILLLLEHGATALERAADGSTALSQAKRWVGKGIAEILIEAGAIE